MRSSLIPVLILAGLAPASLATAYPAPDIDATGALVSVSVNVDGQSRPLYRAVDGSGRFYLEARPGGAYAVNLTNRSSDRVGVVMTVDGLNVISGDQDPSLHGRMYILDPWDTTVVQGWRSSLSDVRRFRFVDEKASYASRSGQANNHMGWIEIAVYRERRPPVAVWRDRPRVQGRDEDARGDAASNGSPGADAPAGAAPPASAPAPQAEARAESPAERSADVQKSSGRGANSFPGTGWGERTNDSAVLVSFEAEPTVAERITLRYEYARALQALGVLPQPRYGRDRLRERESGDGFAQPPRW